MRPAVGSHATTNTQRRWVAGLAVAVLCGCSSSPTNYPDRPIQLISPWAVGGGTDRLARQLARFLEEDLDVPVVVVNATGGAGVTGHSRGAGARPDGYTITMMTVEITMLHWRGLTRVGPEDYEPLALINRDPAAVFVRADDARFDTFADVLSHARREPRALTASGTASGGIWHLALAGALNAAGLSVDQVRWIPTSGAAPALQELISGGLDLVVCSLPEARALLGGGRVRSIGLMAAERRADHPATPTLLEEGLDWTMGSWRGLGLPRGTPPVRRDRLAAAIDRIMAGTVSVNGALFPDVLASEGFTLAFERPERFRSTLTRSDEELGTLLESPAFSTLESGPLDAMGFPTVLIATLCAGVLAMSLSRADSTRSTATPAVQLRAALLPGAEVVAAVLLYALTAEVLGFILTGAAILAVLLRRMGGSWGLSLTLPAVLLPATYTVFATLLRVPLPRGVLGW